MTRSRPYVLRTRPLSWLFWPPELPQDSFRSCLLLFPFGLFGFEVTRRFFSPSLSCFHQLYHAGAGELQELYFILGFRQGLLGVLQGSAELDIEPFSLDDLALQVVDLAFVLPELDHGLFHENRRLKQSDQENLLGSISRIPSEEEVVLWVMAWGWHDSLSR